MSRIKIGWASQDVSTKTPINIPGQFHMRISRGVLDPVTATALVLENDGDAVAFVSLDSVVVTQELVNDVRALAAKKVSGLAPEKIVLNATHAHTGPAQNNASQDFAAGTPAGPIPTSIKIADGNEYRKKLAAILDLQGKVTERIREGTDTSMRYLNRLEEINRMENQGNAAKAEQARLEAASADWTDADRAQVIAEFAELERWHNTPDTAEQTATLPQLTSMR